MSFICFHDVLSIDVSENPSDGVSSSKQIGAEVTSIVPTSILAPSDLEGVSNIKIQVALEDTPSGYHDIIDTDGEVQYVPLVADAVIPIPGGIQVGCIGWGFIRLVTLNNSTPPVALEPNDDLVFRVFFNEALS